VTAYEDAAMIWLTAAVTLFLLAYLVAALLRPEWF
jgi:K+-transporting ATPase KdpF subunit